MIDQGADSFDQRQYQVMRDRINRFLRHKISLNTLATDLEALLELLEKPDPEWQAQFRQEWEVLEEVNAVALSRWESIPSDLHFTSIEKGLVDKAISTIKTLLDQVSP